MGGEECVREQLQATTGRGGTLCQEGHQAEGGHCPLQWHQGMYCMYMDCMRAPGYHREGRDSLPGGTSGRGRSLPSTLVSRYVL
jgi:hypothetical protein